MPMEIRGKRLRVRVARPIKSRIYRTQDVGAKGHTERIAVKNPRTKRWHTQAWSFPIEDVRAKRPQTMAILNKLGVARKAEKLVGMI